VKTGENIYKTKEFRPKQASIFLAVPGTKGNIVRRKENIKYTISIPPGEALSKASGWKNKITRTTTDHHDFRKTCKSEYPHCRTAIPSQKYNEQFKATSPDKDIA